MHFFDFFVYFLYKIPKISSNALKIRIFLENPSYYFSIRQKR